jgi:hypothetical protein
MYWYDTKRDKMYYYIPRPLLGAEHLDGVIKYSANQYFIPTN